MHRLSVTRTRAIIDGIHRRHQLHIAVNVEIRVLHRHHLHVAVIAILKISVSHCRHSFANRTVNVVHAHREEDDQDGHPGDHRQSARDLVPIIKQIDAAGFLEIAVRFSEKAAIGKVVDNDIKLHKQRIDQARNLRDILLQIDRDAIDSIVNIEHAIGVGFDRRDFFGRFVTQTVLDLHCSRCVEIGIKARSAIGNGGIQPIFGGLAAKSAVIQSSLIGNRWQGRSVDDSRRRVVWFKVRAKADVFRTAISVQILSGKRSVDLSTATIRTDCVCRRDVGIHVGLKLVGGQRIQLRLKLGNFVRFQVASNIDI
mmetsp:Transcript_35641/g.57245  ORF Transcript_35641/g.57245 Transcript_35641/m.57245 type:complete len:312 (-) Transcript_35641:922-1857(-)